MRISLSGMKPYLRTGYLYVKTYSKELFFAFLLAVLCTFILFGLSSFYTMPFQQVGQKAQIFYFFAKSIDISRWGPRLWYIPLFFTVFVIFFHSWKKNHAKIKLHPLPDSRKTRMLYWSMVTVMMVYASAWILWSGFPATASFDTIVQVEWPFRTVFHPLMHTLYLLGLIHLVQGYVGWIAFLQFGMSALILSHIGMWFYQKGLGIWGILFALLAFFAPVNTYMLLYLWKDVPNTLAMLWMSFFLMRLFMDDLDRAALNRALIPFILACLGLLMRQNTMLLLWVLSAVLIWKGIRIRRSRIWRWGLLVLLLVGGEKALVNYVYGRTDTIFEGLRLQYPVDRDLVRNPLFEKSKDLTSHAALNALFFWQASAFYAYKLEFELSTGTRASMERIADRAAWRNAYTPRGQDALWSQLGQPFEEAVYGPVRWDIYLDTWLSDPTLVIRTRIFSMYTFWSTESSGHISSPLNAPLAAFYRMLRQQWGEDVAPDLIAYVDREDGPVVKRTFLDAPLYRLVQFLRGSFIFFLSNGFYLLLGCICVSMIYLYGDKRTLWYLLLLFLNLGILFMVQYAVDYRWSWFFPVILMWMPLVSYLSAGQVNAALTESGEDL